METNPVVVYAGTFNPIHYGHFEVAKEVQAQQGRIGFQGVADILFIPIHRSLLKKQILPLEMRVSMIKLSLKDEKNMSLLELDKEGDVARTHYDRLQSLRKMGINPSYWVIGSDAYFHKAVRLFRLDDIINEGGKLLVMQRSGSYIQDTKIGCDGHPMSSIQSANIQSRVILLNEPEKHRGISSTQIRNLVVAGGDPSLLVPKSVIKYMKEHDLQEFYRSRGG